MSEQGLSGSDFCPHCQNNHFLCVSGSAGQLDFGKRLDCGWLEAGDSFTFHTSPIAAVYETLVLSFHHCKMELYSYITQALFIFSK